MANPFGRDIEIGGFKFGPTGVTPVSERVRVTQHGFSAAMQFASATQKASPYWVAELCEWLEEDSGWSEDVREQLMSQFDIKRKTVTHYKSVSRKISKKVRAKAPSFSHARVIASLPEDQQLAMAEAAVEDGLTVSQTAKRVKAALQPRIVTGRGKLEGRYNAVLAMPHDEHWKDLKTLLKMPVAAHTHERAALFLVVTPSRLCLAMDVIKAWDFTFRTEYVWDTVRPIYTDWQQNQHRSVLLATRGGMISQGDVLEHTHASIFREREREDGSPAEPLVKIIETLCTGPYLAVFTGVDRDKWRTFTAGAAKTEKAS